MRSFPQRIVCLTEESVEFLYALGEEEKIVGVSAYAKRPVEVSSKPIVTAFVNGSVKKIKDLKPDLVIGYSDIQKDLARELIGEGLNVYISNHRSIEEILDYLLFLGRLVGREAKASELIAKVEAKILEAKKFGDSLSYRPKVYIEEWDEPIISGIQWFCEIVQLCGADIVFMDKSTMKLAKDRIVNIDDFKDQEIDIIFGCWCGKPVDIHSILKRPYLAHTEAIRRKQIYELEPEIFLQPGIAPISTGIDIIIDYLRNYQKLGG
ncbi:ABC transporter substrate-binding protein [Bacteriovorax sp. Seq25_V]|uniref:ABC transporter substrate-binding protein n=1 Tax=Bacteriovorax sp. Seq25_V TaxID=1201288 RepID=UPI00038A1577|nr:ABC transporter substrate-binding protein [Bacteriovorax sp. Seq25_V]EQC46628.1 oligopeptide ABC transporter, oligopeptide-binding protein [Bacteriovorax sp. Seq25_V]